MYLIKTSSKLLVLSVIALSFFLTSCETDIPTVDNEAPMLRLTISGNGINEVMENPPQELWQGPGGTQYLNLEGGVEYDFSLLVVDSGGVSRATLGIPTGAIIDLDSEGSISTVGVQQIMTVNGDSSDPVTGLSIIGTFTIPEGYAFDFNASGRDYGGQSGSPNSSYLQVSAFAGYVN